MMKIHGAISGAKELDAAFAQLPKATGKAVLKRALIKASKPTVSVAQSLAPRGRTGNLQASITVNTRLNKNQSKGAHKQGDVDLYIGASTPPGYHAHLVEFGTAHSAPRPFMRPAWETTKNGVLKSISVELWAALAKAARTLARKAERGTLSKGARKVLGG